MLLSQLTQNSSILNTQQLGQLQQLTCELNPIQQAWVSGYLAATSQMGVQPAATGATPQASETLTIIYGSHTGNGRSIAEQVKQASQAKGFTVDLISAADYKVKKLAKETHVILIVSTHGEGEPPEDAEVLHKFVFSKKCKYTLTISFI